MASPRPLVIAWLVAAMAIAPVDVRAAEPSFLDQFDEGVFGYVPTVLNVQIQWSELDVDGAPDSGSALLTNTRSDTSSGPVNWNLTCFTVEPGTPYTVGASIRIPEGQDRTGVAQVFMSWYASASCSPATLLSYGRTFEIRDAGSWLRSEQPVAAPAGVAEARLGMALFKNEKGGALTAHFDDLLLAPEASSPAAGAAAALALAALRRRRCIRA